MAVLLPFSQEPDPDSTVNNGDNLKMKLFEDEKLFTLEPNSKTRTGISKPDPNEVKQGAVGTCPLGAVLVATAHVPSTIHLLPKMVNEVKMQNNFVYLTVRTREEFEYGPSKSPQDYRKDDRGSTMDFDYRTWDYVIDKDGNKKLDNADTYIRRTKKEFLKSFIVKNEDYKNRTIKNAVGDPVDVYERKTKNKEQNKRTGPMHFFDEEGNLNDEILPLLPHDQDPIGNFINGTKTLPSPGFRNKRYFTVQFRNKKKVAVTSVLHVFNDEVYYMSSTSNNLWPALIEKAYVIVYGEYKETGGDKNIRGPVKISRTYQNLWTDITMEQAMEDVVGPHRTFFIRNDHPDFIDQGVLPTLVTDRALRNVLARHGQKPTIAGTLPETQTRVNIPDVGNNELINANHAFAVVGYNQRRDRVMVRDALFPATITISFRNFRRDFFAIVQAR